MSLSHKMSLSPYTRARTSFPSQAFSSDTRNSFKSGVSPPSMSSSSSSASDYDLSPTSSRSSTSSDLSVSSCDLSPRSTPSLLSSQSFVSCSHPDWPKRTILSPLLSFCGRQASSYIADEDLLALDERDDHDRVQIAAQEEPEISWEDTKQPPLVVNTRPSFTRRAPLRATSRRRRSDPTKRQKLQLSVSPIVEGPE